MATERLHHIQLRDKPDSSEYTTPPSRSGGRKIPERNRLSHSARLKGKLSKAWESAEHEAAVVHAERSGVYIEFKSDPGADLVTKSLEDMRSKKVRLLNVRTEQEKVTEEGCRPVEVETTYATVYVSYEKRQHFLNKIEEYATKKTPKGNPKHEALVNSIADIRKALAIDSFWQDEKSLIPGSEPQWCEVWLSSDTADVSKRFDKLLERLQIKTKERSIRFPERIVKLALVSRGQLETLTSLSDDIAEYRRAKETARFWTTLENKEQAEWVEDLLDRLEVEEGSNVSVCILDTGTNNGHPLLQPVLQDNDCQAVNSAWGKHDHDKHGTLMAGVTAYGDLIKALSGKEPISLRHHLESVKILPPPPEENAPDLYGEITSQGVSLSEIQSPDNKRIICMAVTTPDGRDRGHPSSWSGALDKITSGADDGTRRLMIVSAGNCKETQRAPYPKAQKNDSVHDPGQSWNVLTVGAYTNLVHLEDPDLDDYEPVAPRGCLSPFSTTSFCWDDKKWPLKPDIVMEGGNLAVDGSGFATECDELSLLSTFRDFHTSHFQPFNMTSAACAQAACMAAQVQAEYPDFWPETIRALLVHSASWPEPLYNQFVKRDSKKEIGGLMRACGYGVPNLAKALYSASNSLCLISQAEIQPFDKKRDKEGNERSGYRTKDMHLYELPWPKEALRSLPEGTDVEMRVTLSYFIEPGPGEIGWQDRYRYASHALRFELKSPTETKKQLEKRINQAARGEDGHPGTESAAAHWQIGQARNKGSIHSDIWSGTANELADSNVIAVYPAIGWWRERGHLGKWGERSRYALIISIETPEETVDLYTPVANQIGITVPVSVRGRT